MYFIIESARMMRVIIHTKSTDGSTNTNCLTLTGVQSILHIIQVYVLWAEHLGTQQNQDNNIIRWNYGKHNCINAGI